MKKVQWLSLVFTALFAASMGGCQSCGKKKEEPDETENRRTTTKKRPQKRDEKAAGLLFELNPSGGGAGGAYVPVPVAEGVALSSVETAKLLRRLSPLETQKGDEKEYAFRASSLPAPRAEAIKKQPFPPKEEEKKADKPSKLKNKGALKVLRVSPEGEVDMAPRLSVTFSQPMVNVTSHAATVAKGVPVRITPDLKGKWRWIGTKTLLFETKKRLPMATRFQATVPAGTKSKTGGALEKAKVWAFQTPPPTVLGGHPRRGPHRLDPVFFLLFDQEIDPQKVLQTVSLEGGATVSLRPAKKDEIEGSEAASKFVKHSPKGRYVVFVSEQKLAPDTSYQLVVGPGTPSKEGPLLTGEKQVLKFKTYAPLRIQRKNCRENRKCRPLSPMWVRFNNPLKEDSIDKKDIKVSPPIQEMDVSLRGHNLYIYGKTRGRTDYKVTFPPHIEDVFGQNLGQRSGRTFHFRGARPNLSAGYGSFTVLDPNGDKGFRVRSINFDELKLKIYKVEPKDWDAYMDYAGKYRWSKDPVTPPGKLVVDKVVKVKGAKDEMVETVFSLKKHLNSKGFGQLVVQVTQWPLPAKRHRRKYVLSWVQVTQLALDAFVDHKKLLGWVSRLKDGVPVSGARLSFVPGDGAAASESGKKGLAKLELPVQGGGTHRVLVARKGQDLAMLPESFHRWRKGRWRKRSGPGEVVRWYVFDDRKLYKPKEEVRVKGWVRAVNMGVKSGVRLLPENVKKLSYTVYDPRRNKIGEGTASVDAMGGFDFQFKIPDSANLGRARVVMALQGAALRGSRHTHRFKIQEFKRPEFETTTEASEGPHIVGGSVRFTTMAKYYTGGGLPGAKVKWRLLSNKGYYRPPNRDKYTFVGWSSRWNPTHRRVARNSKTHVSRTDSRGKDSLEVLLKKVDPARPMSLTASVTVTDVNRRTWTSEKKVVVHPSKRYVGLKTKRYFVRKGTPLKVQTIVTDLDGKLIKGASVEMTASRHKWKYVKGKWTTLQVDPQTCKVTSALKPVECKFKTSEGGRYTIVATVRDAKGRANTTVLTRWVTGGRRPPSRKVKKEEVRLIPDKKTYAPGETAEVLVQAPFRGAEGLLTLRRGGLVEERRFTIKETTATLKIPITDKAMPGLRVHVDVVGAAVRIDDQGEPVDKLPKRPAYASGSVVLKVPPLKRKLSLEVKPEKGELVPGGETSVTVSVKDASGKPVPNGQVAVVVVDEAVLALTGYSLSDPMGYFYPLRGSGVRDHHLRSAVSLMDPVKLAKVAKATDKLVAQTATPGGRGLGSTSSRYRAKRRARKPLAEKAKEKAEKSPKLAKKSDQAEAPKAIAVRKDFSAMALFVPTSKTDAQGQVSVKLKLPDNLTRYRISAVAVSGAKLYGKAEGSVTARMPLMLRPAAPRFLNYGDRFQLPVVVHNRTDKEVEVDVAVRAGNLRLTKNAGKRIKVPAKDRREVRFAAATVMSGTARIQFAAAQGKNADAAEVSLPVWTPATTEAFATYGTIDDKGEVQPVAVPPDVIPVFGGLKVSTSSTALSALTDAVLYLYRYPYECAEQISSRVLGIAALRDVLSAFGTDGLPSPELLAKAIERDFQKLRNMQNYDGGFGFWHAGMRSWPFISIHATHAMVRAKQKGYPVPARMLSQAMGYLRSIESHIPHYYSERSRWVLVAYSLYVRALQKDMDAAKASKAFRKLMAMKNIPLEGIGWLYPVFIGSGDKAKLTQIRKLLGNRVTETASSAHFRTSYKDSAYLILHSNRRVDGILLDGILQDTPKSDLIVKIVRGLLGHRKRGRWTNTQENVWVLLGLDRYFRTFEKDTPAFTAKIWLGEQFAGSQSFRGRSTEKKVIEIPMAQLAKITQGKSKDLVIAKKGTGRLYYRVGMRYAPKDLRPPPANHGFTVQRRYEGVDDPKDVTQAADGTWKVKAGARVRVVVTLVAHSRRTHVALVDPLPAGLEAINTALRGAERNPVKKKKSRGAGIRRLTGRLRSWRRRGRALSYRWWWRRAWYEHQNLRDERAEAFTSLLPGGVYTFKYTARALTPGRFVVPPPKAEEMYHPETFGRGGGDILVVE